METIAAEEASTADRGSSQPAPEDVPQHLPAVAELRHPTRQGASVTLYYPLPLSLSCTEPGCSWQCVSTDWTHRKQTLCRHLEGRHLIARPTFNITCARCDAALGNRPSRHACTAAPAREIVARIHTHVCPRERCDKSFPTARGLMNHIAMHNRRDAQEFQNALVHAIENDQERPPAEAMQIDLVQANDQIIQEINAANDIAIEPHQAMNHTPTEVTPETEEDDEASEVSVHEERDISIDIAEEEDNEGAAGVTENTFTTNDEEGPTEWVLEQFIAPLNGLARNINWDEFELLLEDITTAVKTHQKIRPPSEETRNFRTDPLDCKSIQQLYRRNRRRAVRLILDGESERCQIQDATVIAHYSEIFREKQFDARRIEALPSPPPGRQPATMVPFQENEILERLRKAENTSPGSDGITYKHWRAVDPECRALHLIYKICLQNRRIPSVWKESKTILIPKGGEPTDIKNWRPIALCRTIYKIYASCLVDRLRTWATNEGVFCQAQKGFMPHDGVIEHNFALQTYLDNARRSQGEVCVALLDFSNAFGSMPTAVISTTLKRAGIGDDMIEVLEDIMNGGSTCIATKNGVTEPIEVNSGVRQGCPLSGFLFNSGLESVLRAINHLGQELQPSIQHHCLAYADDVTLIAENPDKLQQLIDLTHEHSRDLALEINPRKCATLHLSGRAPRGPRMTEFHIQETGIQMLEEFQSTKFLGRPIGFNILKENDRIDQINAKGRKILNSKLAPWQRIDALRSFVLPATIFLMRSWQYNKTTYETLDRELRALIKKTLYLPQRAANEYLYGSSTGGTCAIPIAAEDSDLFLGIPAATPLQPRAQLHHQRRARRVS
ncbi:hypothetical protein HAZT_HAZT008687 [Hyalella azteca]|uniref:Reverse transcriptase domain-containing protein n=1 Tax=Hyalella azteca TaxID=294128 RepID=A0A6A0GVT1_HYAAZ|nr:hypothetical protein HAZT_HAZT008687 [Hyalella azteca]